MEDNKYYQPEINELHVGYICEVMPIGGPREWIECHLIYEKGNNMAGLYKLHPRMYAINSKPTYETPLYLWIKDVESIRTKYLDKEDIESVGWVNHEQITERTHRWIKNGYALLHNTENMRLRIGIDKQQIFDGKCKSINELKVIMRLLQISTE